MVCLDLQCPADLLQMQMSFSVHYAQCSRDIQTITSYIILGGFLTLKLDYATFNRLINKAKGIRGVFFFFCNCPSWSPTVQE